jgi:hypothetical protein
MVLSLLGQSTTSARARTTPARPTRGRGPRSRRRTERPSDDHGVGCRPLTARADCSRGPLTAPRLRRSDGPSRTCARRYGGCRRTPSSCRGRGQVVEAWRCGRELGEAYAEQSERHMREDGPGSIRDGETRFHDLRLFSSTSSTRARSARDHGAFPWKSGLAVFHGSSPRSTILRVRADPTARQGVRGCRLAVARRWSTHAR